MMQSVYALDNNYTNQVNTINTQSINKGILKKFSEDIKTIKKRVRFSKSKHIRTYKENTFKEKINNNKITINVPINKPMYTPCKFANRPLQGPLDISEKMVFASSSKSNYRVFNNTKTHKWVYNQNDVPRGHPNAHRGKSSKYVWNHVEGQNQNIIKTAIYYNKKFNIPDNYNKTHKWVHNQNDVPRDHFHGHPNAPRCTAKCGSSDYTKLPVQTSPISGEVDQNCQNKYYGCR